MAKRVFNLNSYKRLWRYQSKRYFHYLSVCRDPILSQVMRRGYAIIPNYWSLDRCKAARIAIDDNLQKSGVKIWTDPLKSDQRLMGAEKLSDELDLVKDSFIREKIEKLYNQSNLAQFTLAAKLTAKEDNLGSGQGWHRDSAFVYQFKAILYLSDVDENLGPFQYLQSSGNALAMLNLEHKYDIGIDTHRFTLAQIQRLKSIKLKEFCAPQGTLLLVNTRGIHRGKPILTNCRYALTNYYWNKQIPDHIAKFVN